MKSYFGGAVPGDLGSVIDEVAFATGAAKVVPVLIVCDTSSSMEAVSADGDGEPVPRHVGMQRGIESALAYMRSNPTLAAGGQVGFVRFGDAVRESPFCPVASVEVPDFRPGGMTPMCAAFELAGKVVTRHAQELNRRQVRYAASTVVVISDGGSSDGDPRASVGKLRDLHDRRCICLIGLGVDEQDRQRLEEMGFPITLAVSKVSWAEAIQTATRSAVALARGQRPTASDLTEGVE
ncbi:MAG: vWA domain-containing protein [Lacipirellulaceae bacterium]